MVCIEGDGTGQVPRIQDFWYKARRVLGKPGQLVTLLRLTSSLQDIEHL